MTARRPTRRPASRSSARIAVSRKPRGTIDEWAEAQLKGARERIDAHRASIGTPTPSSHIPRTWLRLACAVAILILLAIACRASATEAASSPTEPRALHVIDGDADRVGGVSYRLVGFDAPETGERVERQGNHSILVLVARSAGRHDMPRYFFNRTDGYKDVDGEGTELRNLASARIEAVRYLSETLSQHPELVWDGSELRVEVLDARRMILCTVTTMVTDAPAAYERDRRQA